MTSATILTAGAGLVALTISLGLIVSSVQAQSTGGQACELQRAKETTSFSPGTEFNIRQLHKTYTYTCDGDIGQWNESVISLLPSVRVSGSVLLADQ